MPGARVMCKEIMKSRVCFLVFIFFMINAQLFSSGRREESEIMTQNDEWILCITDFDASALPEEKTDVSGLIMRNMVERLKAISYRTRISAEYTYYEDYAWARERSNAARALAGKQEERSRQIFRGEPNWRHRQNIARIDTEIENLRAVLEEIENNVPLINREPVFNLTAANRGLIFPAAPGAGAEFRFCNDQGADAFLAGSITDFHGRYFLTIRLYTVYTRSFVWEDSIIFSHDEFENAIDEITRRLLIVLSGSRPASVAIKAEPEETLLLINSSFAGRGEVALMEHPPGTIVITATAPNYERLTFETELSAGELVEIGIRLHPIEFADVEISGDTEGSVYHGALYMGEAPLTLRLPVNQMEYIVYEAHNMQRGELIFLTPATPGFSLSLPMSTEIPVQSGSLERDRRHYYWTWAGTWITGITAWISYYTFFSMSSALRSSYLQTGEYDMGFYNEYMDMNNFYNGALAALGVVSLYGVYRLIRYLNTANRSTMPAVRTGRN